MCVTVKKKKIHYKVGGGRIDARAYQTGHRASGCKKSTPASASAKYALHSTMIQPASITDNIENVIFISPKLLCQTTRNTCKFLLMESGTIVSRSITPDC